MTELAAEHRMLIDGKLTEAASGKTYGNINPATEGIAGQVADGGNDDMDRAIEAAGGPSTRATGRRTGTSDGVASSS